MEATHSSKVGMAEAEAEASRQERARRNCMVGCGDSRVVKKGERASFICIFYLRISGWQNFKLCIRCLCKTFGIFMHWLIN